LYSYIPAAETVCVTKGGYLVELSRPYSSIRAFLDNWEGVRMVTLELLRCFDDADLGYRLVPQWRPVGELFHHIAGHQYFVSRGVLLRRWRPVPGEPDADWSAHMTATAHSVERLALWLKLVQGNVKEWAALADDRCLDDLRPDNPWHEGMRGWLLLHHAYQDELHHRGQLYAIARHLGKVPPQAFAEEYPSFWDPRKGG
jgi:uncharacterized damage-inducible protein DinB